MSTSYYRSTQAGSSRTTSIYVSRDSPNYTSSSTSTSSGTRRAGTKLSTRLREDDLSASSLTENYLQRRENAAKYVQRAGPSDLRSLGRSNTNTDDDDERRKRKPIVQGGINRDLYTGRALEREKNKHKFANAEKKAKEVCDVRFLVVTLSWGRADKVA